MKKIMILFVACLLSVIGQTHAQSKLESWAELKTFHGVMSQTFHPSETGDLKPIRERSREMADKAKALAASKIPADFNNPKVKEALGELVKGCDALTRLIEHKASDNEVKKALSNLHDTFHMIVERCQKNDEQHKE